ncbi:MAG TPA: serine hydrolase [Capillibacterium sp.]
MGSLLFDLFLLVGAVWSIYSGINKLGRPVLLPKSEKQKKKTADFPEAFTEPSRRRILFARIRGAADLLLAVLILAFLRLSLGWPEKPEVTLLLGRETGRLPYARIINSFVEENNIPAMVVGIIDGDHTLLYGYGYQDYHSLKKGRPVTAQTLFEIGSVTKVFTGLMLAEAVHSGKLPLQMPVAELLETQTGKKVGLDPALTLERLATHTSGLPSLPLTPPVLFNLLTLGITRGNPYRGNQPGDNRRSAPRRRAAPANGQSALGSTVFRSPLVPLARKHGQGADRILP